MTTLLALATMAVGLAYVGLGLLSAAEVIVLRRVRGVSRFGVGFTLMAASCGPHHLLHGWHILGGMDGGGLVAVTTIVGLPCGVVFAYLRAEAALGGRGDRFISGSPWWITAVPLGFLVITGALVDRAIGVAGSTSAALADTAGMSGDHAAGMSHGAAATTAVSGIDPTSLVFVTNVFVTVTYGLVGWFLLRTQVRRRPAAGGWSLSGLALAGVFPTCALMHLVYALTADGGTHTSFFDVLGVPASVYFLSVVHRLYRESIVDWNRRPIVGDPGMPSRPSPWEAKV